MTTVRAVEDGDVEVCLEIVRTLPEYFTADVPGGWNPGNTAAIYEAALAPTTTQ